jgi:NAD(P)H dehydrogenase (quinone)
MIHRDRIRAHLVYAHPEPKSFSGAMMSTTRAALIDAGHQVTISDLYRDEFNPVASAADFALRRDPSYLSYALEQRHAIASDTCAPDIAREVERVLAADCLILIFPVFWFSMPAILKGWIDRVFLSGLFYGGRRFYGRGAMAGRRALIVASMGARPHMFGAREIHGELEPMFRHLTRGILGYVGYDVLEPFWAFHVSYVSDEERRVTLGRLRQHLARLDSLPILSVPDLADYDGQCRPLRQDAGGGEARTP